MNINNLKLQSLKECLLAESSESIWLGLPRSRIHPLRSYANTLVKREDELSFGLSGSKFRKFWSLSSYWKSAKTSKLITAGGAHSNHLLACAQVASELNLATEFLLPKPKPQKIQGNFALLHILSDPNHWRWLEREEWLDQACQRDQDSTARDSYYLSEGAQEEEALWGSLSLAVDLLEGLLEGDLCVDAIYVDAGRGLSAAALLLGLAYCQCSIPVKIVAMAPIAGAFDQLLVNSQLAMQAKLGEAIGGSYLNFEYLQPLTASSFGAVNHSVLAFIQEFGRQEGIILDPVYNAKLFMTALDQIKTKNERALIIHSGGGLGLSGYLDRFPIIK